jgi:hypothetical protein
MNNSNIYCVYLLRLWQEGADFPDEPAPWRIVLEDPHSDERHSFPSLAALMVYLETEMAEGAQATVQEKNDETENDCQFARTK